jgi:hypothetical protein
MNGLEHVELKKRGFLNGARRSPWREQNAREASGLVSRQFGPIKRQELLTPLHPSRPVSSPASPDLPRRPVFRFCFSR